MHYSATQDAAGSRSGLSRWFRLSRLVLAWGAALFFLPGEPFLGVPLLVALLVPYRHRRPARYALLGYAVFTWLFIDWSFGIPVALGAWLMPVPPSPFLARLLASSRPAGRDGEDDEGDWHRPFHFDRARHHGPANSIYTLCPLPDDD